MCVCVILSKYLTLLADNCIYLNIRNEFSSENAIGKAGYIQVYVWTIFSFRAPLFVYYDLYCSFHFHIQMCIENCDEIATSSHKYCNDSIIM